MVDNEHKVWVAVGEEMRRTVSRAIIYNFIFLLFRAKTPKFMCVAELLLLSMTVRFICRASVWLQEITIALQSTKYSYDIQLRCAF